MKPLIRNNLRGNNPYVIAELGSAEPVSELEKKQQAFDFYKRMVEKYEDTDRHEYWRDRFDAAQKELKAHQSSGNPESEAGKAIIASAEDKNITVSFFRVGVVRIMSILAGDLYDKYIITMQEQSNTVKYCRAICKDHTKTFSLEAFLI